MSGNPGDASAGQEGILREIHDRLIEFSVESITLVQRLGFLTIAHPSLLPIRGSRTGLHRHLGHPNSRCQWRKA